MSNKTKEEILRECLGENSIDNQKIRYSVYEAMEEYAIQSQETLTARIVELEKELTSYRSLLDDCSDENKEIKQKIESLTNLSVMELSCKEDDYEIPLIGDNVMVCGELETTIIRIENDKYYFLDNENIEKWDTLNAIELIHKKP